MRFLFLIALLWSTSSFAQSFKLEDLVGAYAGKNLAKDQTATVSYTHDDEVSFYVKDLDLELILNAPSDKGLVAKEEFEQPDCYWDDAACGYIMSAEARVVTYINAQGIAVPELIVSVVESVYNELESKGEEPVYDEVSTKYQYVWKNQLPHNGKPVYSYDKPNPEMDAFSSQCESLVENFSDYASEQPFCPQIRTYDVVYTMEEGFEAVVGGFMKNGGQKVTFESLGSTLFLLFEQNLAKAGKQGASLSTIKKLKDHTEILKAYLAEKAATGATFYYRTASYGDEIYVVDPASKSIINIDYYKMNN